MKRSFFRFIALLLAFCIVWGTFESAGTDVHADGRNEITVSGSAHFGKSGSVDLSTYIETGERCDSNIMGFCYKDTEGVYQVIDGNHESISILDEPMPALNGTTLTFAFKNDENLVGKSAIIYVYAYKENVVYTDGTESDDAYMRDIYITLNVTGHTYGTEGDARFTCTECGYIDVDRKLAAEAADNAHTHDYETTWSSDANKHWHKCTATAGICDEPVRDVASHTYGTYGNSRFTCTVCGYIYSVKKAEVEAKDNAQAYAHAHNYLVAWNYDSEYHWRECAIKDGNCTEPIIDKATHTYGDSGDSRFTCTKCGRVDLSLKKQIELQNKALAEAEAQEEATIVIEMIENLPNPDKITLNDKEAVKEARTAYDQLSDLAKPLISQKLIEKLEAVEEKIKALEEAQEEANVVIKLIENLPAPEKITLNDKKTIEKVREAYDQLSDPAKELIPQKLIEKLEAIEEKIKALEDALIESYKIKGVKVKAKKNKAVITWRKISRKTKKQKAIYKQIQYICIEVSTDCDFKNIIQRKNVGKNKTKITIAGLEKGTRYYFRLYVLGASGIGPFSNIIKAKTKK